MGEKEEWRIRQGQVVKTRPIELEMTHPTLRNSSNITDYTNDGGGICAQSERGREVN